MPRHRARPFRGLGGVSPDEIQGFPFNLVRASVLWNCKSAGWVAPLRSTGTGLSIDEQPAHAE